MTLHGTVSSVYDAAQFDDNFPAGIENHFWFLARKGVLDRALGEAGRRGWIGEAPSILEVGCGTGVMVQGLLDRGHDIRGSELGMPPRSLAQDRIWRGVRAQDLEPTFRSRVDVLMCLDVIEHVPDDLAFLRETLAAFPNYRAVFITVPARPELWSNHDRHYGHYRRYTRHMLRKTLLAAGLEVGETRYVFRSLYVAAAMVKLRGRQRASVMHPPSNVLLHRALAGFLAAEDAALGALPLPGLSILGIGLRP